MKQTTYLATLPNPDLFFAVSTEGSPIPPRLSTNRSIRSRYVFTETNLHHAELRTRGNADQTES